MAKLLDLPQEIIDCTIDEVANAFGTSPEIYISSSPSSADIFSCSLVSRAFVSRTRTHIFRQIILCPDNAWVGGYPSHFAPTSKRFLSFVTPHSATHIESLILCGPRKNLFYADETDLESWVSRDRLLRDIIPRMSALHSLELRGLDLALGHTPTFHTLISPIHIRTLTFRSVWATGRHTFNPILGAFPRIETLRIGRPPEFSESQHWGNSLFALDTAEIVCPIPVLEFLRSVVLDHIDAGGLAGLVEDPGAIPLDAITHLSIRPESLVISEVYSPAISLQNLLRRTESLTELRLDLRMMHEGRNANVVYMAPALQSIEVTVESSPLWDTKQVHGLKSYILSLQDPMAENVKTICVRIVFTLTEGDEHDRTWDEFIDVLLGMPRLQRVTFVFTTLDHMDPSHKRCLDHLVNRSSELGEKIKVRFVLHDVRDM